MQLAHTAQQFGSTETSRDPWDTVQKYKVVNAVIISPMGIETPETKKTGRVLVLSRVSVST